MELGFNNIEIVPGNVRTGDLQHNRKSVMNAMVFYAKILETVLNDSEKICYNNAIKQVFELYTYGKLNSLNYEVLNMVFKDAIYPYNIEHPGMKPNPETERVAYYKDLMAGLLFPNINKNPEVEPTAEQRGQLPRLVGSYGGNSWFKPGRGLPVAILSTFPQVSKDSANVVHDVGCGRGYVACFLEQNGINVQGYEKAGAYSKEESFFDHTTEDDFVEHLQRADSKDVLLLAWPPKPTHACGPVATIALQCFAGNYLIYAGVETSEGADLYVMAESSFFEERSRNWEQIPVEGSWTLAVQHISDYTTVAFFERKVRE